MTRRARDPYGVHPPTPSLPPDNKKMSENLKLRDILHHDWSLLFKSMKVKERLRTCHRLEEASKT